MESGGSGGGGGGGDDVHGLMFGKKIYFEQDAAASGSGSRAAAGGGRRARAASSAGSSAAAGAASSAAGSSAGAGAVATPPRAATPPRCQVEGCGADLSSAKPYYCRHKVCLMHAKTPIVVVAGIEQRFCQQCSRFHQLPEFDQGKRSCRRRLAGHNERRRRPAPGPLTSRFGRLAASFQEPDRFRSFLLDFSYPRVSNRAMDAWPGIQPGDPMPSAIQWQGNHELRPHHSTVAGYGGHAYIGPGGSVAGSSMHHPPFELPPGRSVPAGTDSNCALSLLSTQPWDSTTQSGSHRRSPAMSTAAPVSPSVMASSYARTSTWSGSRMHDEEGARNLHHQHSSQEDDLHMVHPAGPVHHGHFSGELELALQGSGPPNPPEVDYGSGRTFGHSGNAVNWSL